MSQTKIKVQGAKLALLWELASRPGSVLRDWATGPGRPDDEAGIRLVCTDGSAHRRQSASLLVELQTLGLVSNVVEGELPQAMRRPGANYYTLSVAPHLVLNHPQALPESERWRATRVGAKAREVLDALVGAGEGAMLRVARRTSQLPRHKLGLMLVDGMTGEELGEDRFNANALSGLLDANLLVEVTKLGFPVQGCQFYRVARSVGLGDLFDPREATIAKIEEYAARLGCVFRHQRLDTKRADRVAYFRYWVERDGEVLKGTLPVTTLRDLDMGQWRALIAHVAAGYSEPETEGQRVLQDARQDLQALLAMAGENSRPS